MKYVELKTFFKHILMFCFLSMNHQTSIVGEVITLQFHLSSVILHWPNITQATKAIICFHSEWARPASIYKGEVENHLYICFSFYLFPRELHVGASTRSPESWVQRLQLVLTLAAPV